MLCTKSVASVMLVQTSRESSAMENSRAMPWPRYLLNKDFLFAIRIYPFFGEFSQSIPWKAALRNREGVHKILQSITGSGHKKAKKRRKWGGRGENSPLPVAHGKNAGECKNFAGKKWCNKFAAGRLEKTGRRVKKAPKRFAIRRVFIYHGTIYLEKDAFA